MSDQISTHVTQTVDVEKKWTSEKGGKMQVFEYQLWLYEESK